MWRASAVALLLLWCAADGLAQQPAGGRPVTKAAPTRQGLQQVTALLERNDLEGARAVLETTLAQQPGSAQAHHLLGVVFDRQNKLAEAVSYYETAVRLDPTLAEAHDRLGFAYGRLGGFPTRSRHSSARLSWPDMFDAQYHLGATRWWTKDLDGALTAFAPPSGFVQATPRRGHTSVSH